MLICLANAGHIKPLSPMERNTRLRGTFLTYSLNNFQGTVKAHDAVDVCCFSRYLRVRHVTISRCRL